MIVIPFYGMRINLCAKRTKIERYAATEWNRHRANGNAILQNNTPLLPPKTPIKKPPRDGGACAMATSETIQPPRKTTPSRMLLIVRRVSLPRYHCARRLRIIMRNWTQTRGRKRSISRSILERKRYSIGLTLRLAKDILGDWRCWVSHATAQWGDEIMNPDGFCFV